MSGPVMSCSETGAMALSPGTRVAKRVSAKSGTAFPSVPCRQSLPHVRLQIAEHCRVNRSAWYQTRMTVVYDDDLRKPHGINGDVAPVCKARDEQENVYRAFDFTWIRF